MRPTAPRRKRWSIQMEGYGGPALPSPTIGQCLNGGLGWLEVECDRCKTRASIPLDAIRRPGIRRCGNLRRTRMPVLPKGAVCATRAHGQVNRDSGNHALSVGSSG